MAKTYRPYIVHQPLLLPPDLRNWLEPGHIAYFIDEVAEGLDLGVIYDVYELEERGFPPYHPEMMVKLLLYGYCTGIFSSRKIARALHENIAFRFLSRDNYPDFRTLSEFRRIHLQSLSGLFMQVLRLAQETGILKLGKVALDGTKIKANASKHKAMSWKRMLKNEAELEAEIAQLLAAAKRADQEDDAAGLDGLDLPAELSRREDRLLKIRAAKAALEARAAQKAAAQKGDGGEPPAPGGAALAAGAASHPSPKDNAQYNFTDPGSRLMKGGDGFRQFSLRGLTKVKSEWSLVCTAHNLLKLHRISLRLESG